MEDTEFNEEEGTEFSEEPMNSTAIVEEMNRKVNMTFLKMIPPFFSIPIVMSLLLVFPGQIPDVVFLTLLFVAFGITFVSLILGALAGGQKSYVRALRKLVPLSPPEPKVTDKFAVMLIENVYVFVLKKAPYALYFVAFKQTEPTPDSKIDVPTLFWKWSNVQNIEGFRIHQREGTFTIPTPDGDYITGDGYLLVLPIRKGSYMVHYPDMSRGHLLAIVEHASNLITQKTQSIDM